MLLVIVVPLLAACEGCGAERVERVEPAARDSKIAADAVLLGHAGRDRGGDRWVFRSGEAPRVYAGAAIDGAKWVDANAERWLPATRTEPRDEGALTWLAPPPAAAKPGELRLGARSWPVRLTTDAPSEPLDELARALAEARAAWREGDMRRYIATQIDRGERALALGIPTEAATAFNGAAFMTQRTRDFDAAERLLDRAERAVDGLEDSVNEVRIGLTRGYVDLERGRYRGVLERNARLVALARRHGIDAEVPYYETTLAEVMAHLGRHEEAARRMAALESEATSWGPTLAMAHISDRAWFSLLALADRGAPPDDPGWAQARAFAEDALGRAEKLQLEDHVVNVLSNLVFLEYRRGDRVAATRWLERLRARPSAESGFGRRLVEIVQGGLHLSAGRVDAAIEAYTEAEKHARAEGGGAPSEYTWRAALGLGRALAARGRVAQATDAFGRALDDLDGLSRQSDLRTSRVAFLNGRRDAFDAALSFFLDVGQGARALEVSERVRAQLWRDFTREATSSPNPAPCIGVRRQVSSLEGATWRVAASRTEAHQAKVDAARSQLRECLDAAAAATMSRRVPLDAAAGLAALGADEAIVSFVRVAARSRALVARAGEVVAVAPDRVPAQVRGAAHVFLVPGPGAEVARLNRELVPTLLSAASVSFLPLAARLGLPSRPADGAARVLGDPDHDLPYARREVARVAARLAATPVIGDAVTEAALRAPGAGYLHFAGHGELDASDPWQVRLRLADGPLTLDAVLSDPLPFGRVVLSGCETGARAALGERYRVGLVDALVLSGARTVVAALDEIDDAKTLAFFDAFYDAGGRHDPVAAYRAVALERPEAAKAFYVAGVRR